MNCSEVFNAPPATLRKVAHKLRREGTPYTIIRVAYKNRIPAWNGCRALALQLMGKSAYYS